MRMRQLVPAPLQPTARRAYLAAGRATAGMRLEPTFLMVGGQRCGTTSLFKTLSEHPQVMRPPVEKGTDYFTLHYSRGPSWYRSHFPLASTARLRTRGMGHPVAFEACTYYMFHPFAMERIARDLPDIKLVVMLRDPVERAFSAYKHEYARGFETAPTFERALELEEERMVGEFERMRDLIDYESFAHRHHAYLRRGEYADQLKRVLGLFPAKQLFVMDSEGFFADPAGQFDALISFLGLKAWQPRTFGRFNARPSSPMPTAVRDRLHEHYGPHDAELAGLLGRPLAWGGGARV